MRNKHHYQHIIILGIQDVNDEQKNVMTICPAHRFKLAQQWRPSTACCHPEHTQSTQKRKVSIPDRYITPDMAKEIMYEIINVWFTPYYWIS